MEIAIFGGTFNPPTNAHQSIIEESLKLDFIDELWLMPSGKRADKQFAIDDKHRLNMLDLAVSELESTKNCKIVDFEINSNKITRTTDTVKFINDRFPDYSFWYIFGMDSYADMPNWHGGVELRESLNMIVAPRDNRKIECTNNLVWLPIEKNAFTSSTEVRNRAANSQDIAGLVCGGVMNYINSNNLYR
jgi:nicotinate-nucleotide adenylyltransferase